MSVRVQGLRSVDPATGETIGEYGEASPGEVEDALDRAHRAFVPWRSTSFADRAQAMRRAEGTLLERKDACAGLMAREMGKPVREGRSEIEKCAWVCRHFAENAERFLAPEPVATDARESFIAFQPLGTVLAVMPWNFPFWQVFRFAAPALMAGNTAVLKHASNVSGCARAIADLFRDAGFPEGVFEVLLLGAEGIPPLIASPRIAAVTLTGSTAAGREVAAHAGRALKKTVLELGGSDAYVIFADADVARAAEIGASARLGNGGQSCIAAKRFVVAAPVHDAFVERLAERMRARRVGNPLEEATEMGPLARVDLRDDLHGQVERSVAQGARIRLGGTKPDRAGAWYPPTILTDVRPGMPAYDEELFGPVAAVLRAQDDEDAIRIANDSRFGLGAAVFTSDLERARRVARDRLEAGSCFVNAQVHSDPRLPFGGIKESGYGRELGVFGIREFVNVKSVYVA